MGSQKILNNIKVTLLQAKCRGVQSLFLSCGLQIGTILQRLLHQSQISIPSRVEQLSVHSFSIISLGV